MLIRLTDQLTGKSVTKPARFAPNQNDACGGLPTLLIGGLPLDAVWAAAEQATLIAPPITRHQKHLLDVWQRHAGIVLPNASK